MSEDELALLNTVTQSEKTMEGFFISGSKTCLWYTGMDADESEDFSLSEEDYPTLARIWDNDADDVFNDL